MLSVRTLLMLSALAICLAAPTMSDRKAKALERLQRKSAPPQEVVSERAAKALARLQRKSDLIQMRLNGTINGSRPANGTVSGTQPVGSTQPAATQPAGSAQPGSAVPGSAQPNSTQAAGPVQQGPWILNGTSNVSGAFHANVSGLYFIANDNNGKTASSDSAGDATVKALAGAALAAALVAVGVAVAALITVRGNARRAQADQELLNRPSPVKTEESV
mmetsp:Transcript_47309/g.111373  ORF Transcript_47309/g.111373 Transcript_47309/m.111373 type:complete len:219 (+) Transcript_47309:86-742(+)